jgi:hypothetical protein
MGEVTAQGARVVIDTCCTPSASGGAGIEGDTDSFVSKQFVDPLPLLIGDQPGRASLAILVGVTLTAEVAPEGR